MSEQADVVIEIQGLTKDFRVGFMTRGGEDHREGFFSRTTVRALDHLSLQVNRGEMFGFLGPNGAGKTTTLKLLMGLMYPTSGSALILGMPIERLEPRTRIGYLPENPYFYDYLTGFELLKYTASLFGLRGSGARNRIVELIRLVGLTDAASGRQLRKYSKGMLQRIGIAQALVNDPDVLFMDEPMSGLDPLGRREVRDIMLSLRQQGKTIFFSSHILADVEALCDRAAILNNGRLVRCGAISELTKGADPSIEVVCVDVDWAKLLALTGSATFQISANQTPGGARLYLKNEGDVGE
ncbi:MAG TPA: ABC transporter ATP-binding protein, partial [Blastocatellia bacterium]|nr:ABC transporter ATP-binding protein [Blastocatellia bacterium]